MREDALWKGIKLVLFLLAVFLAVPIVEIIAFIKVGSLIGLGPTLALTIITAIVGAALVRYQGFRTLMALKQNLDNGHLPVEPAIHAGFLLVAGLCLLTPGFFTDTIGFVLLVPAARIAIARWMWRRVNQHHDITIITRERQQSGSPHRENGPVINLEAQEIDEGDRTQQNQPPSPWHKNGGPTR